MRKSKRKVNKKIEFAYIYEILFLECLKYPVYCNLVRYCRKNVTYMSVCKRKLDLYLWHVSKCRVFHDAAMV